LGAMTSHLTRLATVDTIVQARGFLAAYSTGWQDGSPRFQLLHRLRATTSQHCRHLQHVAIKLHYLLSWDGRLTDKYWNSFCLSCDVMTLRDVTTSRDR